MERLALVRTIAIVALLLAGACTRSAPGPEEEPGDTSARIAALEAQITALGSQLEELTASAGAADDCAAALATTVRTMTLTSRYLAGDRPNAPSRRVDLRDCDDVLGPETVLALRRDAASAAKLVYEEFLRRVELGSGQGELG